MLEIKLLSGEFEKVKEKLFQSQKVADQKMTYNEVSTDLLNKLNEKDLKIEYLERQIKDLKVDNYVLQDKINSEVSRLNHELSFSNDGKAYAEERVKTILKDLDYQGKEKDHVEKKYKKLKIDAKSKIDNQKLEIGTLKDSLEPLSKKM